MLHTDARLPWAVDMYLTFRCAPFAHSFGTGLLGSADEQTRRDGDASKEAGSCSQLGPEPTDPSPLRLHDADAAGLNEQHLCHVASAAVHCYSRSEHTSVRDANGMPSLSSLQNTVVTT